MYMPNISVIVPTYNCGEFISEAIESILNQTYPATEIIIVDDGSTDNTEEIVNSFGAEKITYIRQANSGVSTARNLGLAKANGDYITFLDADDIWLPLMLESQINVLENNRDITLCFTNFVRFIHKTKEFLPDQFSFYPELATVKSTSCSESARLIEKNAFCTLVAFSEIPAYTQVIMFRKSTLANLSFNSQLPICEDLEFFLKICSKGQVAFNPLVLAYVRRHDTNATKDTSIVPHYILKALLSVKESTHLSESMLFALNARIVKAYISYSSSLIAKGYRCHGWKIFLQSLPIESHALRKLKGFFNLCKKSFLH